MLLFDEGVLPPSFVALCTYVRSKRRRMYVFVRGVQADRGRGGCVGRLFKVHTSWVRLGDARVAVSGGCSRFSPLG